MFNEVITQVFIEEAVWPFFVLAALQHKEHVTISDAGLVVPIVWTEHQNRNRMELIAVKTPELAGGQTTWNQFL
jgi:hypothetical protein